MVSLDGDDSDDVPPSSVVNELYGASLKVGNRNHDCRRGRAIDAVDPVATHIAQIVVVVPDYERQEHSRASLANVHRVPAPKKGNLTASEEQKRTQLAKTHMASNVGPLDANKAKQL